MNLRPKLFLPLILCSVLFGAYAHYVWIEKYISTFLTTQENDTRSHLRTVAEGLVPMLLEDRLASVYDNLDALLEENPHWISMTLVDKDNVLLYPIEPNDITTHTTVVKQYKQAVSFNGPPLGYLTLYIDFSNILNSAKELENNFHLAMIILLGTVVFTIGLIVELVVRRPIMEIARASSQITEDNYTVKLPRIRNDEIGELIENFNDMRNSLEAYHSRLKGEITSHKQTTQELLEQKELASYQASHDALTGLINRREFERRVNHAIELSASDDSRHVLLYMDLDQFKIVNDTSGHIAGDMLLRQLSVLLQESMRQHDTLARLGGDEFGVLFEYCAMQDAMKIAVALLETVQNYRFTWGDKLFNVGVSIGVAEISAQSKDYFEILSAADSACYAAKENGRNRIQVYQSEDVQLSRHKGEMLWVTRLLKAIEDGSMILYCQPIVGIEESLHGERTHYEVLLKVQEAGGRLLDAESFIPAAERYNLITTIDRWVVEQTLIFLNNYQQRFPGRAIQLSVNISGVSLGDKETLSFIENIYVKYLPPAGWLGLEITETAAIQKLSQAGSFMRTMKSHGCQFYLDDFGSGLSSFNYLKTLPVDFVKIDGLFVEDIVNDTLDFAMVKSINEICHVMGKKTIAEYVKNEEILRKLRTIGVDFVQGFFVGDPQPLSILLGAQPNVRHADLPKGSQNGLVLEIATTQD